MSGEGTSRVIDRGYAHAKSVYIGSAIDDSDLDVYQFRVYCHLKRRAGDDAVWEGQEKMAAICNMSRKKLNQVLSELEALGWIKQENRKFKGQQTTNMIYLLEPPCNPQLHGRVTESYTAVLPTVTAKGTPNQGTPYQGISPLPPSGDGGSTEVKPAPSPKAKKTAAKKQGEVAEEQQPAEHERVMTILATAIYGSEENTPTKTWPRIAAISKSLRERHSADEIDYLIKRILQDGFWRGKLSTANIEERLAIAAGNAKASYANSPEARRRFARELYGDDDEILGVI